MHIKHEITRNTPRVSLLFGAEARGRRAHLASVYGCSLPQSAGRHGKAFTKPAYLPAQRVAGSQPNHARVPKSCYGIHVANVVMEASLQNGGDRMVGRRVSVSGINTPGYAPGFFGHYQDLGIPSLKRHDSAGNRILSVTSHRACTVLGHTRVG